MKDTTSIPKTTGPKRNVSSPLDGSPYRRWLNPWLVRYLRSRKRPILAGPWRGEVGFEALYWQPWLARLAELANIPPERLIPISRGGTQGWYRTPVGIELYAMRTAETVRIENQREHAQLGLLKQVRITRFDREVLADTAQTLGVRHYDVVHPAWMYAHLSSFWGGERGLAWLIRQITLDALPVPALPATVTLPPAYVCARFYARATWPASELTATFAKKCLETVASADQPVILLGAGLHTDDHVDYRPKDLPPHVLRLEEVMPITVENNLAVQSAVLARSLGFVGTYGGLAQLALRYQKPVVSFVTDWHSTCLAHRHLSDALALQMRVAFHVLPAQQVALLQAVLPRVMVAGAITPNPLALELVSA